MTDGSQTLELHIRPQGKVLQEYYLDRSDVSLIRGPLGSGKTIMSCLKIIDLMCEQAPNHEGVRPSRFVAVRNTYSELFSTTIKDWMECAEDLGPFKSSTKEPPHQDLDFLLPDGTRVMSEMIFVSFDRPAHVKKARGMQITGVWLNETKELSKAVVDILDLRHGRYPSPVQGVEPTWHGMLGDYNSPDDDHWLYHMAEETKPEGWTFHVQPGGLIKETSSTSGIEEWVDNPVAENVPNLPREYYTRGQRGKSEDWIKVNLANEYGFVIDGKPVHPEYIDSVHCAPDNITANPAYKLKLGFDWGRTPACAILQQVEMDRWVAIDEFVTDDFSAAQFAPELKLYLAREYPGFDFGNGWADPAGTAKGQATDDTPIRIVRANGIPCQGTIDNKPLNRRSAVSHPLRRLCMDGKPALIISPKCKMMRKGLAGGFCYRRLQTTGEKYTDEPDKNEFSHIVEALEYVLYGEGEGQQALRETGSSWGSKLDYTYAQKGII